MIELLVSGIHIDRFHLAHPADFFIGVTARLEIQADGKSFYAEEDFPVVELAADLADWLRNDFENGKDFEFDSMSTPEPGWVWVRRTASGWRLGSLHQERPDPVVRSDSEVRAAVEGFVKSVKEAAARELGEDVRPYVDGPVS